MTPDLPPPRIEIHGDLQVQGDTETLPELRLRLRPEVHPAPELHVYAIADVRGATGQAEIELLPVAAWGQADTPIGTLTLGRMPIPLWGLGLVANPGGCLDCVSDFTVDRLSFAAELGGHVFGLAADMDAEDVRTGTLSIGRLPTDLQRRRALDAQRDIWGYGLWSTWRSRSDDGLGVGLIDGWARYERGELRVEAEGLFVGGSIESPDSGDPDILLPPVYVQQAGGALQLAWRWVDLELGFASGDRAPGRGLNGEGQIDPPDDTAWTNLTLSENHFIDRVQWRRRIGQLSDVVWVHPGIRYAPSEMLDLRLWFTGSRALVSTEELLNPELGATLQSSPWRGLQLRMDLAYLVDDGLFAQGALAWVY